MKLKDGFIIHEVDGKYMLVSVGENRFPGVVKTNETAAFIIGLLNKDTKTEELVKAMVAKYEITEDLATSEVEKVLSTLRKIGSLDD